MAEPRLLRRYLDNAATSGPKPPEVLAAWEHAGRAIGAAAGRGTYREAVEADRIRMRCRAAVARLLGDVDELAVLEGGGFEGFDCSVDQGHGYTPFVALKKPDARSAVAAGVMQGLKLAGSAAERQLIVDIAVIGSGYRCSAGAAGCWG